MLALVAGCLVRPAAALQLVEPDWIDEDVATFSGERAGTSAWRCGPGQAAVVGADIELFAQAKKGEYVTFDAAAESSGNQVEVESLVSFGLGELQLPQLPADAQCGLVYHVSGLKVWSAAGWSDVTCAVDLSDPAVQHRLLFFRDAVARTFTVKIDGAPVVDRRGCRVFRLVGEKETVKGVGFSGAVTLRTVRGGCRTASPETVTEAEVHAAFADLPAHPRLGVRGPEGLAAIREDPSPEANMLRERIVSAAEKALVEPPVTPSVVGKRLSGDDDAVRLILVTAAAAALTDDVRFAARARDEMLSVCAWENWVPTHYLGVGNLLRGLAFGYDWLYGFLTEQERKTIRQAMIERGYGGMSGWSGWDANRTNWSQVCWQGVIAAALAIYEDDAARSEQLVRRAVPALAKSSSVYAPNGAYPEGPGYWAYGTGRLCRLLDQLEKALGTTFGLCELPGFVQTGGYPLAMDGATGRRFNYSDCSDAKTAYRAVEFYLAEKAGHPEWTAKERAVLRADVDGGSTIGGADALATLLWASFPAADAAAQAVPTDYYGGGENPVAAFRESDASYAMFLGVKGGKVGCNHGHMDVGSFVYEADGVRWAADLGSQNYNAIEQLGTIDLWNMQQDSLRWDVFRLGADSHNLVTVDGKRLLVSASAEIVAERAGEVSVASLDLSSVYGADTVSSATRTFTFDRKNRTLRIVDDLRGLRPGASVRWAMITPATVLGVDGDAVRLGDGPAQLDVRMTGSASGGRWEVADVSAGPHEWDAANPGCSQLRYWVDAPAEGVVRLQADFLAKAYPWPAGTTFYGLAEGQSALGKDVANGSAQTAVGWWTAADAATATQEDVPSPWLGAAAGYRYVLLSSKKLTATSVFPEVPLQIGLPNQTAKLSFNGGVRLTAPTARIACARLSGNADGLTTFDGDYTLTEPGESVEFAAAGVAAKSRGCVLQGAWHAASDVTMLFTTAFSTEATAPAIHRIAGDFSSFKGRVRVMKPTHKDAVPVAEQCVCLELLSPSALGDPSAPCADALTLGDRSALTLSDRVVQDGTRGIRFALAEGESGALVAETGWTLAAPLTADAGTLVKEGGGRLSLAGPLAAATLVVTNGTLSLTSAATPEVAALRLFCADARDASDPLVAFDGTGVSLTGTVAVVLSGADTTVRGVFGAAAGTTNHIGGKVTFSSVAETPNRKAGIRVAADARLDFDGKASTSSTTMTVDGPGEVRFNGGYSSASHFHQLDGSVVFARSGNSAYGFVLTGGRTRVEADNALKVTEKSGRSVSVNNVLDVGATSQRIWGLTGRGTIDGVAGSVVAPAAVEGETWNGCGVSFAGAVTVAPTGGRWRLTGVSTTSGELRITSGVVSLANGGSWTGTNVTVSGTGRLVLENPAALSAAYGRLSVAAGGRVSVPAGVVARVAALSVDGVARPTGVYGSAEAAARHTGVTADAALAGEGVLLVTGGATDVPDPYGVTGVLDVTGPVRYAALARNRLSRIVVRGGSLGLDLPSNTVLRVTTVDLRDGATLDLAAGVTLDAASVFVDGVPVAQGTYAGGALGRVTGAGVLQVLVVPRRTDRRAERFLQSLRDLGNSRRWLASWLRPWSVTDFAVAEDGGYRPADAGTLDLEQTSRGFKLGGHQPLLYFYDFNAIAGTWNGALSYAQQRAALTALVKEAYRKWHAVPVFSWHPENPYVWTGYYTEEYGSAAYRCRAVNEGYPAEHRYVMKEILENTGGPCGFGRNGDSREGEGTVVGAANPRAWFDARLDEIASFVDGLRDDRGRPIPVVSRLYHECEDSWQWWGADYVSVEDYKRIFRYTAEALRWRLGEESGRVLFAFSPDRYCWPRDAKKKYLPDGKETARTNYLKRYAGDDVTDIIGYDDYTIGDGATDEVREENIRATIRQIALISEIAAERGKACGLFESMGEDNCTTAYFPWLFKAMTGEGCRFGFANTWRLPNADTECQSTWCDGYLDRPQVLTVGKGYDPLAFGLSLFLR